MMGDTNSFDDSRNHLSESQVSVSLESSATSVGDSSDLSCAVLSPSQDSLDTSSEFRKVPSLSEVYETSVKDRRRVSKCRNCAHIMKTNENDRLVSHIKTCRKTSVDVKNRVNQEYQSLIVGQNTGSALLTKMIVENNACLTLAESSSFKEFVHCLNRFFKPPTRRQISERYIPRLSHSIEESFIKKANQATKPILSIEFDHWSDANQKSLLGVIATTISGQRYVCDLIEERSHASDVIVEGLKQSLTSVPKHSINAIISDSASSCLKARQQLIQSSEYKHIIHHRCIAHLLNRMGGYLSDPRYNPAVALPLSWAKDVSSLASKAAAVRDCLRNEKIKQVKRATPTRWYSTVDMLNTLLSAKEIIIQHAENLQDCQQIEVIVDETNWSKVGKLKEVFDPLADCIAMAEKKDSSLGEAVKAILELGKSLFSLDWNDPVICSAIKSYLAYFGPAKLKQEFDLMIAAYALDRRYKLDYLTQDAIDLALVATVEVAIKNGLDVRKARRVLLPEFDSYCAFEDDYATDPGEATAAEWWSKRSDSGALQRVALRIAFLRSSSANIERTFSSLKYVQGSWRLNLGLETMKHILRIKISDGNNQIEPSYSQENECDETSESQMQVAVNDSGELDTPEITDDSAEDRLQVLDVATRKLYLSFSKLIDFTKVTSIEARAAKETCTLSASELVSEFRKSREVAQPEGNVADSRAQEANAYETRL